MIFILQTDYGIFQDLVYFAGLLILVAGALGLGWRGRADWEPSEVDIPRAPQKVGGLIAAIFIGILWTQYLSSAQTAFLVQTAIILNTGDLEILIKIITLVYFHHFFWG